TSAPNGPSSGTPTIDSGTLTTRRARIETGTEAARTRNGDGPTYGSRARTRRSIPCDPAPAISPMASGTRPPINRMRAAALPPDRIPIDTQPRPRRVASQPTTNRAGADRPSMVNVELPRRVGGSPASSGPGAAGGSDGFNAPAADPAGSPAWRRLSCGRN